MDKFTINKDVLAELLKKYDRIHQIQYDDSYWVSNGCTVIKYNPAEWKKHNFSEPNESAKKSITGVLDYHKGQLYPCKIMPVIFNFEHNELVRAIKARNKLIYVNNNFVSLFNRSLVFFYEYEHYFGSDYMHSLIYVFEEDTYHKELVGVFLPLRSSDDFLTKVNNCIADMQPHLPPPIEALTDDESPKEERLNKEYPDENPQEIQKKMSEKMKFYRFRLMIQERDFVLPF